VSIRILVVDDDEISCLIARKKLERLGYAAEFALSAEIAWELLQEQSFDVVISDWVMDQMDGLELCRAIRALHNRKPNLPYTYIILLTVLSSRESRVEAIRTGVDDYLVKPVDSHELFLRLIVAERISALHRRNALQAAESLRLNQALHAAVRRDPLTGVGNRHLLAEATDALCASFAGSPQPLAIILVDIDHFKAYNDIYLHLQGDDALRDVARVLDRVVRGVGSDPNRGVFRFGGEEFVALVDGLSEQEAARFAESLRRGVEQLGLEHRGNPPVGVVTISVGLAVLKKGPLPLTPLAVRRGIREADRALFQAKDGGRNQVVVAVVPDAITR